MGSSLRWATRVGMDGSRLGSFLKKASCSSGGGCKASAALPMARSRAAIATHKHLWTNNPTNPLVQLRRSLTFSIASLMARLSRKLVASASRLRSTPASRMARGLRRRAGCEASRRW